MGSKINPQTPRINAAGTAASAPRLIREAGQRPQGARTPPVHYTPEMKGGSLSKSALFPGRKD